LDSKKIDYPVSFYEDQIISLLSSNPYLKHYDICLCPFSPRIVHAIDENDIHLNKIAIYVTRQNSLESQCDALLSLKEKQQIKSMTLDYFHLNHITATPLKHFDHLTHIEIASQSRALSIHVVPVFLQALPLLDSITLSGQISCTPLYTDTMFTSQVKHIDIARLKIDTFQDLKSINYFFKFLFPKCPLLETFSLVHKFPTLEEPLEEEMFLEFEKDNPHLFDYLDLHLILDFEQLKYLKAVHLRSDSRWYQFIYPHTKASTIPAYYYLYDTRVGEFQKKFNILPRYFFTTLFLNKKIFVNSIKV
jgi:hypothetical protein